MRQSNAHPSKSADKETGLKTTIKKDDNSQAKFMQEEVLRMR